MVIEATQIRPVGGGDPERCLETEAALLVSAHPRPQEARRRTRRPRRERVAQEAGR